LQDLTPRFAAGAYLPQPLQCRSHTLTLTRFIGRRCNQARNRYATARNRDPISVFYRSDQFRKAILCFKYRNGFHG